MNILQPYNDDTLELISDDNEYNIVDFITNENGKVKLSVFTESNVFQDSEDLQKNIDFYTTQDSQRLFLKPNEYLDRNGFSEGNYNLQYDFIERFAESSFTELFHLSEISPSRKEIRFEIINGDIPTDGPVGEQAFNDFFNVENQGIDVYGFNSYLELSRGRLVAINGYAFDKVTRDKVSLVLKLNQPLPLDIATLQKFNIVNKILVSQVETIFFIDRERLAISGLGLQIDEGYATQNVSIEDSYSNRNDITGSSGTNIVEEIVRQQKDLNLNIDYGKFDNHIFFGSAKSKLENFKNKAVKLEGLYNQISQSLAYSSSLKVVEKRKSLFDEVRKIEDEFTHFEHFMYHDGQSYSTSSAPGIGSNLAGSSFSQIGYTQTENTIQDSEGFDKIHNKEKDGYLHLTTDLYNVENPPFYNSNDFFYLSFILRGGGDDSEYSLHISGGFQNEFYDVRGTNTKVGNYVYSKDRKIPFNAWSGSALLNPQVTGSNYQRYVFKAQQNYFRPIRRDGLKFGLIGFGDETYGEDATGIWEILSGSNAISGSLSGSLGDGFAYGNLDITGKYTPYYFPSRLASDGTIDDVFPPPTGSFLPQGDLFPVFTQASGDKKAFFTDVVVTKNDPRNIHPFSKIYRPPSGSYAGSSEWNDWYNTMETIAENYDNDNINSLVNNLPFFLRTNSEHKVLRDFVNMLGEQFDLLRSYINNYENFYTLGYKNPNSIPDNLLPIIGNTLGFDLKNPLSGSLENYLQSTRGDEVGDRQAISSLWTKILNNIVYVYKTKGTMESLNTLLNLYGYDTNNFELTEFGGSFDDHNPSVVTNDSPKELDNGLNNVKGNVSFREKTEQMKSLNLSTKTNLLQLDWWSNDAEPNGVEFIFRTTNTPNTQTLARSSGSASNKHNWDLRIVPSGSSNSAGKLEFRLNDTAGAGSVISNNAISMSTDFIQNVNDFKFYNVLLQRQFVTSSYEATSALTQSYHLFVGRQEDDKIKDIQHISMSSLSSNANQNYITASGQTSNNLVFGDHITGSIAEIRAWDSYISMSKFKQHILNYKSVVGGKIDSAREDLVYHYPLSDNESSTVIKDFSSTNKVKSFDKQLSSQPSLSAVTSSMSTVKNFSFQVRGTDQLKSKKQFKIGSDLKVNGNLNSKVATLSNPKKANTNQSTVKVVNKIGKSYSYVDAIDAIVINAMADFQLDDYLDDGVNDGIYTDLINLRKQIITERNVSVDIPSNLASIEKHTDDPEFIERVETLVPAKTKFEFTYEVKNDVLHRSKHKRASLQTELNPNKVMGSTNLTEPVIGIDFNENKHNVSIDVPLDEMTTSGFANENLREKSIDVLSDEIDVSGAGNENVLTNNSTPLDVVDLSNSANQSVFNLEPSNFKGLLLGSKNEFFKNHGKSENQTFFKAGNPGSDGNYNTYKYEDRVVFRTIGETEEFFPTSGSYKNRTGTNAKQPFNHHDNFRHFGNRYYVDSGSGFTYTSFFGNHDASVNARMVGRTLFFSSSNGEIFYPINHYFKVGTSKDGLTNLIYKGTQNDGSNPPKFDKELDTKPKTPAYIIKVGGSDTVKKLKVIR